MSTWQDDNDRALADFLVMAGLAGEPVQNGEIEVEYLAAPHKPPARLPAGKMAVYAFWWDGVWLKVSTCRVNLLLPAQHSRNLLALLETFLHVRLKPRYER